MISILKALIAIPQIGVWIKQLVDLLVSLRDEQLRKDLEETTILLKAAKTKEERDAALKRWADNISR